MIQKGTALPYRGNYIEEIEFIKSAGFEFFQIWFFKGDININTLSEPKDKSLKKANFPFILHAVFNIPDYEKYGQKLLDLLDYFEHDEVIIHPIFLDWHTTKDTIFLLAEKTQNLYVKLAAKGIKLYLENNSILDSCFNSVEELRVVFDANPNIGLLLDIAHINSYEHLKEIVNMRFPECIHIADKHFDIAHEHLPLGDGDLDFKMIFSDILSGYGGKIILEAIESKEMIIKSKQVIDDIFA